MVTDLQYIAIVAFLVWGLAASLCGVFANDPDAARLIWRKRDAKPEASNAAGQSGRASDG
jgi:hypothetical protein